MERKFVAHFLSEFDALGFLEKFSCFFGAFMEKFCGYLVVILVKFLLVSNRFDSDNACNMLLQILPTIILGHETIVG